jgi:hypothetical protein
MDNSIRLKELQVGNGALRKKDKGLSFFFFLRVFFFVMRGGKDNFTPF